MAKQFFKDLPDTTTPLTASRLNGLLDGEEAMGQLVVDSIRTKNMFDGILELGGYTNQGVKDSYSTPYRNANMVSVKPNTTYTTSINGVAQQYVMFYYASDGSFISSGDNRTGTFTTPNDCYYVNFRCYTADFTPDFKNLKVQLEEGSNATNYMPYQNLGNKTYTTTMSYNTTYIDTPVYNKISRTGNVVQIYFIARIKNAWSGNVDIITGLPANSFGENYRFYGFLGNNDTLPQDDSTRLFMWTQIYGTTIRIYGGSVQANKYLYISQTYITTD